MPFQGQDLDPQARDLVDGLAEERQFAYVPRVLPEPACDAGQGPAQEQAYWRAARAHGLRARLRQEVEQADLAELLRLANSPRGKKRLTELLKAGYDDPAATGQRQSQK